LRRLVIFLVLMLAATAPANAQCLSQAQAREAVASGQAKPLGSVAGAAGGEIVKADLCRQGGGYVYRLSVKINGKVVTKTINASR
jgi:uncharacterized membrane protein YkoI